MQITVNALKVALRVLTAISERQEPNADDLEMLKSYAPLLARLDEVKARQAVRSARDPFFPRLVVGSGLAYSNGFPMSIEGSAPSIVQAQARAFIFNRPQSYQVAVAKENVRGATLTVA